MGNASLLSLSLLAHLPSPVGIAVAVALALPTLLVLGGLGLARAGGRRHTRRTRVRVTRLFVYAVKSCAAMEVKRAELTPRGLRGDRAFMVIDGSGTALTQREAPSLVLVHATLTANGSLILSAPDVRGLRLHARAGLDGDELDVRVSGRRATATDVGDAAAAFFAAALNRADARLVRLSPEPRRIPPRWLFGMSFDSSFADVFPYMAVSDASLMALRRDTGDPLLDVRRFRANIVVDGCTAFAEDAWISLAKEDGSVVFEAVEPCARGKVPTVLLEIGDFDADYEPTSTLNWSRKFGRRAVFGQYLLPQKLDDGVVLSVGDSLDVLERVDVRRPDTVRKPLRRNEEEMSDRSCD